MRKLNSYLEGESLFIPKKLVEGGKEKLVEGLEDRVRLTARNLVKDNWRFFVIDQRRGMCYYGQKVITIPMWAAQKGIDYKTWYLCHEMSHALAPRGSNHGPEFMAMLKEVCPERVIHFELGYKPRNASAAGIICEI